MASTSSSSRAVENELLCGSGVVYHCRFVGSLPLHVSMRDREDAVMQGIISECIRRVARAAGRPKADDLKLDELIEKMLVDSTPVRTKDVFADVSVCTESITIAFADQDKFPEKYGALIARHTLKLVSCASPAYPPLDNFVGYVARLSDAADAERRCFVFEFENHNAVVRLRDSIHNAFLLLDDDETKASHPPTIPVRVAPPPPTRVPPPPPPPRQNPESGGLTRQQPTTLGSPKPQEPSRQVDRPEIPSDLEDDDENDEESRNLQQNGYAQPAGVEESESVEEGYVTLLPSSGPLKGLHHRSYFHGTLDRSSAEQRLSTPGDFLLRFSATSPGQVILSIRSSIAGCHHMQLLDDAKVRTLDREFETVVELIDYHALATSPPISTEKGVQIVLKRPVAKPQQPVV